MTLTIATVHGMDQVTGTFSKKGGEQEKSWGSRGKGSFLESIAAGGCSQGEKG